MLAQSLPSDVELIAALPKTTNSLPQRHLGLVQANELPGLPVMLDELASLLGEGGYTRLPPPVAFAGTDTLAPGPILDRCRVAVAHDVAFSFSYRANIDCLMAMGAELLFFSPLADESVPAADALYLPGGYPELHAARLAGNSGWLASLRAFAHARQCGGMMVLFDTLITLDGTPHPMAGLLPGTVMMGQRLASIGLQWLALPEGELRGHSFHYSRIETPLEPLCRSTPSGFGAGEPVYRRGAITAYYLHAYFPSNPRAVAALLTGSLLRR
jgi:cobyrinic acid a,c-diamide synthase